MFSFVHFINYNKLTCSKRSTTFRSHYSKFFFQFLHSLNVFFSFSKISNYDDIYNGEKWIYEHKRYIQITYYLQLVFYIIRNSIMLSFYLQTWSKMIRTNWFQFKWQKKSVGNESFFQNEFTTKMSKNSV